MLNIVLFGPPGAGKGTQSEMIIATYGLRHLSTGDIFRANIKGETELGQLAKRYMDKGELVPDEVTIRMLEAEADKHPDANGFIFDGFPRTTAQAEALDVFLNGKGTMIRCMISLDVPEAELVTRLVKRGEISGRADDNEETIRKRIAVYNAQTLPVEAYYQHQGKLHKINGLGSIEDISDRIRSVLAAFA